MSRNSSYQGKSLELLEAEKKKLLQKIAKYQTSIANCTQRIDDLEPQIKAAIQQQSGAESFEYENYLFSPVRNFYYYEDFQHLSHKMGNSGIHDESYSSKTSLCTWNHQSFYIAAKECKLPEADVFLWEDKLVIPCQHYLAIYIE